MNEDECNNCFSDLSNGQEYDYTMDVLFCKNCHDKILENKISIDRVSFIKHGNWKIESLEKKLKIAMDALEDIDKTWDISDFECVVPKIHPGELARNDSIAAGAIARCVWALKKIGEIE